LTEFAALVSVSHVQVWKKVDGVEVLVHDSAGDQFTPERLILRGNTVGLTDVVIDGVGTVPKVDLGSGIYAVDVSMLARGTYTYTPMFGTVSGLGDSFTVRGSGAPGQPVEQESGMSLNLVSTTSVKAVSSTNQIGQVIRSWSGTNSVTLGWSSLEQWGAGEVRVQIDYVARNDFNQTTNASRTFTLSAADALTGATVSWGATNSGNLTEFAALVSVSHVQVWKKVDGVEVLVHDAPGDRYDRRLVFSSLPTTAQSVTFQYRKAGSADPFQAKTATKIGNGWFSTNYDDIPNGTYEYRLLVDGSAASPITGSVEIMRGGRSLLPPN
jgi:hypothetical protein